LTKQGTNGDQRISSK